MVQKLGEEMDMGQQEKTRLGIYYENYKCQLKF
jgi:hypothetical protein